MCKSEKQINIFLKNCSECRGCKSEGGLKTYYEKKDKITNQRNILYEKNKDKLLQK